jgi:quercetin dioxygenase-like cupin family protein
MSGLTTPGILACTGLLAMVATATIATAGDLEAPLTKTMSDASLQWGPCPPVFPAGCEIAVLHGNPANPNADVFFKVAPDYVLPHHWHTSAERMVLVAGELHVTYDGHPTAMLKPGMYAYGPAKAPHEGKCQSREPCVLFIAFEGPVDVQVGPAR